MLNLPENFTSIVTVGIGAPAHVDPTSKRLHVYFNHGGISEWPQARQGLEDFLNEVWSHFGTVTDTYYHQEYSFGFITFATHEQAACALEGLANVDTMKRAIEAAINSAKFNRSMAQKYANDLFYHATMIRGSYVLPSWAKPRPGRF